MPAKSERVVLTQVGLLTLKQAGEILLCSRPRHLFYQYCNILATRRSWYIPVFFVACMRARRTEVQTTWAPDSDKENFRINGGAPPDETELRRVCLDCVL